ncbi:hypothetical protein ACTJKO_16250 [Curtobacterium sp. 22159]|uniref:hypothetical protein n=1 Tax=Curtobacterium sp. 22159 TaxID=3453882 RepID=UPI003F86BEA6
MNVGRAVIGASTIGALVLAVGLGVAVAPAGELTTTAISGGACSTFPVGSAGASSWFMAEMQNDTGSDIRVHDVRAVELRNVTLDRLAIAPEPRTDSPGLIATDDAAMPEEYGRTVPVDSGFVVPAHCELDIVGRIVLRDPEHAGEVQGFAVTTTGNLGTLRTSRTPETYGVAIARRDAPDDTPCFVSDPFEPPGWAKNVG